MRISVGDVVDECPLSPLPSPISIHNCSLCYLNERTHSSRGMTSLLPAGPGTADTSTATSLSISYCLFSLKVHQQDIWLMNRVYKGLCQGKERNMEHVSVAGFKSFLFSIEQMLICFTLKCDVWFLTILLSWFIRIVSKFWEGSFQNSQLLFMHAWVLCWIYEASASLTANFSNTTISPTGTHTHNKQTERSVRHQALLPFYWLFKCLSKQ